MTLTFLVIANSGGFFPSFDGGSVQRKKPLSPTATQLGEVTTDEWRKCVAKPMNRRFFPPDVFLLEARDCD